MLYGARRVRMLTVINEGDRVGLSIAVGPSLPGRRAVTRGAVALTGCPSAVRVELRSPDSQSDARNLGTARAHRPARLVETVMNCRMLWQSVPRLVRHPSDRNGRAILRGRSHAELQKSLQTGIGECVLPHAKDGSSGKRQ